MNKHRIYRFVLAAVCILLAALLCASVVSIFLEGSARRESDPLESIYTAEIVADKLIRIAPLFLIFFVLLLAGIVPGIRGEAAKYRGKRAKPAENPIAAGVVPSPETLKKEKTRRKTVQTALVAAAVLLIIAGILNGSAYDVLIKAITICTECVGLG